LSNAPVNSWAGNEFRSIEIAVAGPWLDQSRITVVFFFVGLSSQMEKDSAHHHEQNEVSTIDT
jgi:hypothetical protein